MKYLSILLLFVILCFGCGPQHHSASIRSQFGERDIVSINGDSVRLEVVHICYSYGDKEFLYVLYDRESHVYLKKLYIEEELILIESYLD